MSGLTSVAFRPLLTSNFLSAVYVKLNMSDDPNGQDIVNPCLCIIVDSRVGKDFR